MVGHQNTHESKFNSKGFESWIRGTYNNAESIKGNYSNFKVANNTDHGAEGPAGGTYMQSSTTGVTELVLTATGKWGKISPDILK
jgi:hypothetical protein